MSDDTTPKPAHDEPTPREKMINRAFSVVLIAVIAANAWYYFTRDAEPAKSNHILAGTVAPTFDLPRLQDTPDATANTNINLETLRGKVVLLDFWATYCQPCKKQMPILERMHKELPPEKFTVISINGDDPRNANRTRKVSSYIQRSGYSFPVVLDNGSTMSRYQVRKIPTLMILDPKGNIQYVHTGVTSKSDLMREVEKLLEKS